MGIEVIQALEWLDIPFTGATSEFFEPTREAMKRVCRAWGIDTPDYVVARTEEDIERGGPESPVSTLRQAPEQLRQQRHYAPPNSVTQPR